MGFLIGCRRLGGARARGVARALASHVDQGGRTEGRFFILGKRTRSRSWLSEFYIVVVKHLIVVVAKGVFAKIEHSLNGWLYRSENALFPKLFVISKNNALNIK
ncbi:MAG: hypothetical protein KJ804_09795 [Proteobacteria bacterium]|nr:hypothetical protein [Pseudomonadota bacterium]